MKYIKKLDIKLVKGEYKNPIKGKVKDPKQIYDVFKSIKDKAQETLLGVYLDKDLEISVYDILSTGAENGTTIAPSEIFGHVFGIKAKSFILVHNHPKGDPNPSDEDRAVIDELKKQSKIMRLDFLDFLIIGDMDMNDEKRNYWSMFEEADGGDYSLGSVH